MNNYGFSINKILEHTIHWILGFRCMDRTLSESVWINSRRLDRNCPHNMLVNIDTSTQPRLMVDTSTLHNDHQNKYHAIAQYYWRFDWLDNHLKFGLLNYSIVKIKFQDNPPLPKNTTCTFPKSLSWVEDSRDKVNCLNVHM